MRMLSPHMQQQQDLPKDYLECAHCVLRKLDPLMEIIGTLCEPIVLARSPLVGNSLEANLPFTMNKQLF
jgi:hypothetical protein